MGSEGLGNNKTAIALHNDQLFLGRGIFIDFSSFSSDTISLSSTRIALAFVLTTVKKTLTNGIV